MIKQFTARVLLSAGVALMAASHALAFTPVQQPPETSAVPGNLLFALSVEYPTGLQASYNVSTYDAALVYDGYFDNRKCYTYTSATELFAPTSAQNSDADKTCPISPTANQWSGNLLNWLTMTNLDQFRAVMTGGTRDTVSPLSTTQGGSQNGDSSTNTILIRSFTDRNEYHTNKTLPNTAAVPADFRGGLVRNGGYGTKIIALGTRISQNTTTTVTVGAPIRTCSGWQSPGGNPKCYNQQHNPRNEIPWTYTDQSWTNNTGVTVTLTVDGSPNVLAPGASWINTSSTSKTVTVTYTSSVTVIPNASSFQNMNETQQRAACSASPVPSQGTCFNVRLEVCKTVPGVGMEANCKGYSNGSKPEGLVQQYANELRYGAFGYLNDDARTRNGGVLRAAMKSVGKDKAMGDGTVSPNTNKEWNETTGIQSVNPDPTDATASAVSKSGVINYLNQFGYAAGYKTLDPVSELYYAALRYLRGLSLPTDYTNNLDAARKDGFPVIGGSDILRGGTRDPLINTCQRNFLLTLGDIFTHSDKDITDSDFNVATLWNNVTSLEGSTSWTGGSTEGGPYIAGMAHWAHTNDIRPDLADKQTVATYIVDVLENYNGRSGATHEEKTLAASRLKTQYWLAAKYGGYDKAKAKAAGNELNPNADRTSWDADSSGTDGYNVPDNWFAGNSPSAMRNGLSRAFADIANKAKVSSSSSAATTSSRQTSSTQIVYAGYDPQTWTGSVIGCQWKTGVTLPAVATRRLPTQEECRDATNTYVSVWNAADWLDESVKGASALTNLTRKIVTAKHPDASAASVNGQRFQWGTLDTAQKTVLSNDELLLNFLRGDRSRENDLFHKRRGTTLLGDIVHSGVTYVAGASFPLIGVNYKNHNAYRASTRTRPPVVYVGANDGMLHAFSATDGKELFAYIPQAVFNNLPKLSTLAFTHQYFVDSTPMVGDIETGTNGLGNWKTLLIGGLGAGGKGFYALDISNQSSFDTAEETTLASQLPQWEFTSAQDADLGFTFNEPSVNPVTGEFSQIAKVAHSTVETGAWRVIVGNGFGSSDGKAVLYMLDATNGGPAIKITADAPAAKDNGLSTPTPVDTDGDGLVDTIYAGDLKGNMHKFQFSKLDDGKYVLAKPSDSGANWRYLGKLFASSEPIVSAPSVGLSCKGSGWNVSFGSGKLNEVADYTDLSARSFVSIDDLADAASLTVNASDLATITPTSSTVSGKTVRNWTAPSLSSKKGWKIALTNGERVLGNSTLPADTGSVVFATTKPSGDICIPGNSAFVMQVSTCTGAPAQRIDGSDTAVGGTAIETSGELKVSTSYINREGDPVTTTNMGEPSQGIKVTAPKGRYNWREILTK